MMKSMNTMLTFGSALAMAAASPAASTEAAASSAAAASAAEQAAASSSPSFFLFLLILIALAIILFVFVLPFFRRDDPSIIHAFGAVPGSGALGRLMDKVESPDTTLCGGPLIFEQLDEEGYTVMEQPLALTAVQGDDYIVVIPPKGWDEPVFNTGNIVQTIRLKNTKAINTVSKSSPLAVYRRRDGSLALMANPENLNPTTRANKDRIDRVALDEIIGEVFYCGDQALIINRVNQNLGEHNVIPKGKKRDKDTRAEDVSVPNHKLSSRD